MFNPRTPCPFEKQEINNYGDMRCKTFRELHHDLLIIWPSFLPQSIKSFRGSCFSQPRSTLHCYLYRRGVARLTQLTKSFFSPHPRESQNAVFISLITPNIKDGSEQLLMADDAEITIIVVLSFCFQLFFHHIHS